MNWLLTAGVAGWVWLLWLLWWSYRRMRRLEAEAHNSQVYIAELQDRLERRRALPGPCFEDYRLQWEGNVVLICRIHLN